jgi:succinyl-diaminopimelate desuccinylase
MAFETVSNWLEGHVDEMVELQRALTARPALAPENGGDGEWDKARALEDYLRAHGLARIEHFDCPDKRVSAGSRPNFVATVPGRQDEPQLWILSHMDIVPPGERLPDGSWKGWDTDPYVLQRAGDLIMGRGVEDNQQSIVSSVFAARAILEDGLQPARTLQLLFVADEETGSRHGLGHVLDRHRDLFGPADLIVVPDGGDPDGAMIEVAEKSALWLEFRVKGRQAHGSRPDMAVNAFRAGAWLVHLLDDGLRERFSHVDHLFNVPRSTFEPTLHEANVPNVNTIPGEDVFCFDCRVLPSYSLDSVLAYVQAQCRRVDGSHGTTTEVTVRYRQDAPPATSPDAPVVALLKPAIERVYGVKPKTMGIGGLTVASLFREKGFAAAVWMTATDSAHQVNEVCSLRHQVGDARVFAHCCLSEA